ncbi:MAG TPA: hypothetical protein VGQ37_17235 [Vicinamibacterales bacterium]|nr:hypothetical protein [Vicinamibacterales bacterium]
MSRILFVMLHPGFVRYYDDALTALAAAGHDVHVAFEITRRKLGEDVTAQRLAQRSPRITCGTTPERRESVRQFLARADHGASRSGQRPARRFSRQAREEAWESLATTIRLLADYLRFFDPAFRDAVQLRARAEKRLPRVFASIARGAVAVGARPMVAAALRGLERVIPTSEATMDFVRDRRPDLLLVTPLIELGSQQVDYVKAARALGVRSALCVASWDNLTSKGLVRVLPERIVVWNEAQKREAVSLHRARPDQVVVTGAQLFDRWFAARPTRSREEFCRDVALDPARPFVLYLGSSIFIAPDEVPFAERWVSALRHAGDPAVANLGVLVRPHPANARQWRTFDPALAPGVALWPPIGTDPNAEGFQRDFFESMYFSEAVVGINTSAQIEASIVGRPVFTIRTPEFAHAQEGTLHFRHLVGDGGPVRAAASLDEHVAQLSALLRDGPGDGAARRAFVQAFVRPHGLDRPAVPVFAGAIERHLASPPPAGRLDPAWVVLTRPAGLLLAYVARALAEDRPLWAYALRPPLAAAVALAATGYRAAGAAHELRSGGLKRARRAVWRAWYESSRRVSAWRRRTSSTLVKRARHAGGAAKRAVRRQL